MLGRKKKSKKVEKKVSKKKVDKKVEVKKPADYQEYDNYINRLIYRAKREMGIEITKIEWKSPGK